MKIIDARSGRRLAVGDVTEYPVVHTDGLTIGAEIVPGSVPTGSEGFRLEEVKPGLLKARALVRHHNNGVFDPHAEWVPLVVRWLHPGFFGQHVAFVPS